MKIENIIKQIQSTKSLINIINEESKNQIINNLPLELQDLISNIWVEYDEETYATLVIGVLTENLDIVYAGITTQYPNLKWEKDFQPFFSSIELKIMV